MTISEVLKKSKIDLKGKKKDLLKPVSMYYLIFVILHCIFTLGIMPIFKNVELNDLSDILEIGVIGILFAVVYLIVFAVITIILNYGMAACVTKLKREDKIGFGTFFRLIKENGFKAFKNSIIFSLKILGYTLVMIIFSIIWNYFVVLRAQSLIALTALAILLIIVFIICLNKIILLTISDRLANYLVYDFPEESNKKIRKKAKEIAKKQQMTLINTILLNMLKILPLLVVGFLLSSNIDMFIWKPEVSTFWGYITNIESTTPMWWNVLATIFIGVVNVGVFLNIILSTSAFYENVTSENLFGEEFVLKKEKMRTFFIALGLLIVYIAVFVGTSVIYTVAYQNALKDWAENSYNNALVDEKEVEDIKIESVKTTKAGDLVIKLDNSAKALKNIYVLYDDEIDLGYNQEDLYTKPNEKMYAHFSQYNYSYTDNELIIGNDKDYQVVELKDSLLVVLDGTYKTITVKAIFYKGDDVVDVVESDVIIGNGKTYAKIQYPSTANSFLDTSSLSKKDEFDKYELYFKYTAKEDTTFETSKYLKTKLLGIVDKKAIVEIKNESKDIVHINKVNAVLSDLNNNLVEVATTSFLESYTIQSNDTIYVALDLKNDDVTSLNVDVACIEYTPYYRYATEKLKTTYTDQYYSLKTEVENTTNDTISSLEVNAVFLKDGKAVGYAEEKCYEDLKPGEKTSISLTKPQSNTYDEIKVSVVSANIY